MTTSLAAWKTGFVEEESICGLGAQGSHEGALDSFVGSDRCCVMGEAFESHVKSIE